MTSFEAIENVVAKLARDRGLRVDRVQASALGHDIYLTVSRRSFRASTVIRDIETRLEPRAVFDIVWEHVRRLDMQLRGDELRAVFDFTDDDDINFVGTSVEEGRRIGAQMLRTFLYLARGDEVLRQRVVEMGMAFSRHDQLADLIEAKEKQGARIAAMPADDCERLALALMARVERLRSGAS